MFKIVDIPGKGKGMVASQFIPIGCLIVKEKPSIECTNPLELKIEDFDAELLQLANVHPELPIEQGIFKTNALPKANNVGIGILCKTISRVNHSCVPNAFFVYNSNKKMETLHATCNINEGEEITMSYIEFTGDIIADRLKLKERFKFECTCNFCKMDIPTLKSALYQRFYKDRSEIQDNIMSNPKLALKKIVRCINLQDELSMTLEHIYPFFYDGFQLAIMYADVLSARKWLQLSCAIGIILHGKNHELMIIENKLMEDPTIHPNYNKGNKGKNKIKFDQEDLNAIHSRYMKIYKPREKKKKPSKLNEKIKEEILSKSKSQSK